VEKVSVDPPKVGDMAQRLDQPGDVVETALATTLATAASAGQWGVVETLARELEARRVARAGAQRAGVIDLGDEKRRRGR